MELYDIETDSEVYKEGVYTADPVTEKSSPELMIDTVYKWLKFFLTVISLLWPLVVNIQSVLVLQSIQGEISGLSVLQLDAHTDLRNEYNGSIFNHAV